MLWPPAWTTTNCKRTEHILRSKFIFTKNANKMCSMYAEYFLRMHMHLAIETFTMHCVLALRHSTIYRFSSWFDIESWKYTHIRVSRFDLVRSTNERRRQLPSMQTISHFGCVRCVCRRRSTKSQFNCRVRCFHIYWRTIREPKSTGRGSMLCSHVIFILVCSMWPSD